MILFLLIKDSFLMTEIHIRLGPMFSSKSVWLSGKASHFADLNKNVVYINHLSDVRDVSSQDGILSSHRSDQKMSKKVNQEKLSELLNHNLEKFDVICIDEGQFFKDLRSFVETVMKIDDKKIIYISALDGDFNQRMFSSIIDILPLSTTFKKKTAVCSKCLELGLHYDAPYTQLSQEIKTESNIIIGGKDLYSPVCIKHLMSNKNC
jgi:thymidine kinase